MKEWAYLTPDQQQKVLQPSTPSYVSTSHNLISMQSPIIIMTAPFLYLKMNPNLILLLTVGRAAMMMSISTETTQLTNCLSIRDIQSHYTM